MEKLGASFGSGSFLSGMMGGIGVDGCCRRQMKTVGESEIGTLMVHGREEAVNSWEVGWTRSRLRELYTDARFYVDKIEDVDTVSSGMDPYL